MQIPQRILLVILIFFSSFLAYMPLVYVMAGVKPTKIQESIIRPVQDDGYHYTADQLDPWLGYAQ